MEKHEPDFKIESLGGGSKLYTCKVCGFFVGAFDQKTAINVHNQVTGEPKKPVHPVAGS